MQAKGSVQSQRDASGVTSFAHDQLRSYFHEPHKE